MSTRQTTPQGGKTRVNGLLVATAVVVLMVVGVLVGRHYFGPAATGGSGPRSAATMHIGGPFTLTDQNGKRVTDRDFRGKYMLIYFGYTYCPDVCPTALNRNAQALEMLGDRANKIVPIMITIDPQRDTPQHLKEYVAFFDPRLVGLTGSADEIAKVAKEYGVYYAKVPGESGDADDYLMDHTAITFLMGPDGAFLGHFSHGVSAELMAKRLRELL